MLQVCEAKQSSREGKASRVVRVRLKLLDRIHLDRNVRVLQTHLEVQARGVVEGVVVLH